jgi:two-component system, cell cycle response regulator DivK
MTLESPHCTEIPTDSQRDASPAPASARLSAKVGADRFAADGAATGISACKRLRRVRFLKMETGVAWILPPERGIVARILVVEDSPDNMKLFRTLLALRGHEVTGLPGGEELLETIDRTDPELVLMDIQLPGRDGFTLLDEIRTSSHAVLKVLALTAHAMSGDRERAMQAGFDGYITKPIDIRAFPELVQRALAGEAVSQ